MTRIENCEHCEGGVVRDLSGWNDIDGGVVREMWCPICRTDAGEELSEKDFLRICEQVCRNLFNRLEVLEMYDRPPNLEELQRFHEQAREQVDGYRDALERYLVGTKDGRT